MNLRTAAIALSLGRAALGFGLLAIPERIAAGWIGPSGREGPAATLARSVGIRDLVIGAGGALSLASGDDSARAWLGAAAICDSGDILAALIARDSLPANGVRGTVALAGGSAVVAALAAARG